MHPCSAKTFDSFEGGPSALLDTLRATVLKAQATDHVVAFGEIGLDYDRLMLTGKEQQLKYFEMQLDLAVELQLPLFLHSRAAGEDFERLLVPRLEKLPKKGLVHSFTGTLEEMERLVALGLDIGVNGCSLKTEENLTVVRAIPLDHIQIETDGPWVSAMLRKQYHMSVNHLQCEMRASHASAKHKTTAPPLPKAVKKEKWETGAMVKGRNEPATIPHVAHVVASVKGIPVEELCEA